MLERRQRKTAPILFANELAVLLNLSNIILLQLKTEWAEKLNNVVERPNYL